MEFTSGGGLAPVITLTVWRKSLLPHFLGSLLIGLSTNQETVISIIRVRSQHISAATEVTICHVITTRNTCSDIRHTNRQEALKEITLAILMDRGILKKIDSTFQSQTGSQKTFKGGLPLPP